MLGTQAAGAAPLVLGEPVKNPETIATAIRIGAPASWHGASRPSRSPRAASWPPPMRRSWPHTTWWPNRRRIRGARIGGQHRGLLKAVEDGWVSEGSTVVCTVTGNGLKDPDTALKDMPTVTPLPVDPVLVVESSGWASGWAR